MRWEDPDTRDGRRGMAPQACICCGAAPANGGDILMHGRTGKVICWRCLSRLSSCARAFALCLWNHADLHRLAEYNITGVVASPLQVNAACDVAVAYTDWLRRSLYGSPPPSPFRVLLVGRNATSTLRIVARAAHVIGIAIAWGTAAEGEGRIRKRLVRRCRGYRAAMDHALLLVEGWASMRSGNGIVFAVERPPDADIRQITSAVINVDGFLGSELS